MLWLVGQFLGGSQIPPFDPRSVFRAKSPLVGLYHSMRRYFQENDVRAEVYLGLKNRDLWDTSRVVLIDGEFDGSLSPKPLKGGTFGAPWNAKRDNPRELVSWERPITLSIRGVDPSKKTDEAAQTEAIEALIESTVQAVWNAVSEETGEGLGQAQVEWGDAMWMMPPVQNRYGSEFLLSLTYKCVLFDLPRRQVLITPVLSKGPVSSSSVAGSNASIFSVVNGTVTIYGLPFIPPDVVGMHLQVTNAASPANNGTFPISGWLPQGLEISNSAAVAPDTHNGAIVWQVVP